MHHLRRCIALIFIALVALTAMPSLNVGATMTFIDPQNRFSVDIPDGWQRDGTATNNGITVQFLATNPDGAFNVTTTALPSGVTIDAVPQLISTRLSQQFSDFQQTNLGAATVAGEQGSELDYTATNSAGTVVATSQIIVQHNGVLYLVTFAARPEDIETICAAGMPMLDSWQWLM